MNLAAAPVTPPHLCLRGRWSQSLHTYIHFVLDSLSVTMISKAHSWNQRQEERGEGANQVNCHLLNLTLVNNLHEK